MFVAETINVTSGTSLNITGAGLGVAADGGGGIQLFYVDKGSSLHLSDMTLSNGNATDGGAIFGNEASISLSGNMSFISNSAAADGGAIHVYESTLSWDGDGNTFSNNSAGEDGGAIFAYYSTVSWNGDGATFTNNSAYDDGGGIYAFRSTMSWDGDGVQFISNSAFGSSLSSGGGLYVMDSTVSWDGDGTQFSYNSASRDSRMSWDGDGTTFRSNFAGKMGGAINALASDYVRWDGTTTFDRNEAEEDGGALAFSTLSTFAYTYVTGGAFIENRAIGKGGAVYFSDCDDGFEFTDVTFQSNSAGQDGGAVAAYETGDSSNPGVFTGCSFFDNKANGTGGAVETLSGQQEFYSCGFEGNSAGEERQIRFETVLLNSFAIWQRPPFLVHYA